MPVAVEPTTIATAVITYGHGFAERPTSVARLRYHKAVARVPSGAPTSQRAATAVQDQNSATGTETRASTPNKIIGNQFALSTDRVCARAPSAAVNRDLACDCSRTMWSPLELK